MTSSARPRARAATGVAVSLSLMLAACGGGDEPSDSPDGSDSQAPASPESAVDREATAEATTDEAAATTETLADRSITIAATGDVLPHASVVANAKANAGSGEDYDFGPMFAEIEPLISSADLALCHMETPISADNTTITQPRVLIFSSPRELAANLASAGYDGCDFASNHTIDQGLSGLTDTEDVLTDAGLGYAGPTGYEDRAGEQQMFDVEGIKVAHLAYTYTFPNASEPNTDVPSFAPWMAPSLWPLAGSEGILSDAEEARGDGAELVVVSMHWGQEYNTAPTDAQTKIADELLESGEVDLILGTHVHVPQACEEINNRFALYGLGNSLSNQSPDVDSRLRVETQEGMVAEVTLTLRGDGEVTSSLAVQPTRVNLNGHVIEPVGPDHFPETARRTQETLTSLGTCDPEILKP